MKKPLIVVALILGLAGLMAISAKEIRTDDISGELEISFHYFPSYGDSMVNPNNFQQQIDSSFVSFRGTRADGTIVDTTGVLEESFASQSFWFEVRDAGEELDSLWVIWKGQSQSSNLYVCNAFAETENFPSQLKSYDDLGKLLDKTGGDPSIFPEFLSDSLDAAFSLQIGVDAGVFKPTEIYRISGNLAVVIITIDPSEIAHLTPVRAAYKVKGKSTWKAIPQSLAVTMASPQN